MRTFFIGICVIWWALAAQPVMARIDSNIAVTSLTNKVAYKAPKNAKRKKISSSQAAKIVKSRFGGKILKVKSTSSGYRVKVLQKNGRISSVFVDGNSGRIGG